LTNGTASTTTGGTGIVSMPSMVASCFSSKRKWV
jgi:hypothetical protein